MSKTRIAPSLRVYSVWRRAAAMLASTTIVGVIFCLRGAAVTAPPAAVGDVVPIPAAQPLLHATPVKSLTYPDVNAWMYRSENAFADAVDSGAGRNRETWLATRTGVKEVDRRAGVLRRYTQRDGLPTDNIAAVCADQEGVWCLASESGKTTLCQWDEKTGRWELLNTVPKADLSFMERRSNAGRVATQSARLLIATSPRWVAFTAGAVSYLTNAVVYLLNKQTKAVTSIPWDSSLRADNDALGQTSLALLNDDTLVMGTNLGLLCWNQKEQRWRRYLPARHIDGIAVAHDDVVWAISHPRKNEEGVSSGRDEPAWTLARVSLRDGTAQEWEPPANDTLPDPRIPTGLFGGQHAQNLRHEIPVAVSVAADGAIWTSHTSAMSLDNSPYSIVESHGWSGAHGGFERFEPTTARWTAYPLRVIRKMIGKLDGENKVLVGGTDDHGSIRLDDLPDDAVRPLATTKKAYSFYGNYSADSNTFWVGLRYPEWINLGSPPSAPRP